MVRRIVPGVVAVLTIILSTSCSIYQTGFNCPPGKGIGCASTSEVLEMIKEGENTGESAFDDGENTFNPEDRRCK